MTNKEIISDLRGLIGKYNLTDEEWQTIEKTIEVLSNSDGDCISRKAHNLCNSCTNIGCEFQSGIVRTKCALYMPPHIETDNCGNYVVMQPTVDVLDKIRAEIEQRPYGVVNDSVLQGIKYERMVVLEIIDKYKAESEK